MVRFVKSWLGAGGCDRQPGVRRRQRVRPEQGDRVRPAVRPHRTDGDRGHGAVPRLSRLHRPGEQQGRRRGLQDQGHRGRQRVQGAAGHRGARALQEGGRGARGPLRHAADRGARPRSSRRTRSSAPRPASAPPPPPTASAIPYTFPIAASYWSQAGGGGRVRQGEAGRQPQGQEDRLPVLRQPGRQGAAADPRGSRQERGLRAAHLRGAARRASRWARRCSTSSSATSPTS